MDEITGPFPLEWPTFMMNAECIYSMIPTGSHLQRASMPLHDSLSERHFPDVFIVFFSWLFDMLTWECSVAPGHGLCEVRKHRWYPNITHEALKSHLGWREGKGKTKGSAMRWIFCKLFGLGLMDWAAADDCGNADALKAHRDFSFNLKKKTIESL